MRAHCIQAPRYLIKVEGLATLRAIALLHNGAKISPFAKE